MTASDAILTRYPKTFDLSLDRLMRLLDALDNPQRALPPVIHIAGTNGKGSTQAMIRAGLESTGARVHAYTSPHLVRFHERICLAGRPIDETALATILHECEIANDGAPITFFEFTTAAGLLAFSRHPADFTLLEVGLGGRLDATNVIDRPRLSIITPVSMDHTEYLGDTLSQIATEKAGIIKRRVPVIVAPQQNAALDVIEAEAARRLAPVIACGRGYHCTREGDCVIWQDDRGLMDLPLPALPGPHQVENAGTAIAALRELGFGKPEAHAALTQVNWHARMQRLCSGPLVDIAAQNGCELWLDGGHNPAGGKAAAETLRMMAPRPTHLICGMLNTKDVCGYMAPLAGIAHTLTAISIPGEANTLPADQTAAAACQVGLSAHEASDLTGAIRSVCEIAPGSRVLICGSLYLAGQVLRSNS